MEEIIKIFKELQVSSGKKLQEILEREKNNILLKDILFFIYNPYITTGLSKKKISKDINKVGKNRLEETALLDEKKINNLLKNIDLEQEENTTFVETYKNSEPIYDIFYILINNNTGTYETISIVRNFISLQPKEYQEIYEQIFTKELKLGITSKTINKVWKNLIPEFNVMLAHKYFDRKDKVEKDNPNIILSQKLDGIRCLAKVQNGNVTLYSRQGQIIEGLIDIENELRQFPDYCYDGELLLKDENNSLSKDLYRATVKVVNSDQEYKQNVTFNLFDCCPIEDFEKGYSNISTTERKEMIDSLCNKSWFNLDCVKNVPNLYEGEYDEKIINEMLDKQILLGHEGLMLNYANAPYECKRSTTLLKIKKMQSCDLKIVGFEEGTGKNVGTLGALIVDYKGSKVGVGSGFTDEDRTYVWEHKKELAGRICEVQYFEETTNQQNNDLSLRFPVFKCIREIGKEVSYY